jgi:Protein of unknown function (DUF2752)
VTARSAAAHTSRGTLYGASGALLTGVLAYIAVADPHNRDALYPPCPFKMLTGWNCPACGGLRMTHDLIHGNIAAAVADNVYLLIGIPALIAWILYRRHTGQPATSRAIFAVITLSAIAWTIARNFPGFPLVPTLYGG